MPAFRSRSRPVLEALEPRCLLASCPRLVFTPAADSEVPRDRPGPAQVRSYYGVDAVCIAGPQNGPALAASGAGQTIAILNSSYPDTFVGSLVSTAYSNGQLTLQDNSAAYAESDLAVFNQAFGLPQFVGGTARISPNGPTYLIVGLDGTTASARRFVPSSDKGSTDEFAQDVEWAHAFAPQANIIQIVMDSVHDNLRAALELAVDLGATVISTSDAVAETTTVGTDQTRVGAIADAVLGQPQFAHVPFMVAAGDGGAGYQHRSRQGDDTYQPMSSPGNSPLAILVGGTELVYDASTQSFTQEVAWGNGLDSLHHFEGGKGGSGGGVSLYESASAAQQAYLVRNPLTLPASSPTASGLTLTGNDSAAQYAQVFNSYFQNEHVNGTLPSTPAGSPPRLGPDVSLVSITCSQPGCVQGVAGYNRFSNPSSPWSLNVNGTSLATPLFAALVALANEGRANQGLPALGPTTLPALLYTAPAGSFTDITSGNNGYPATPGFDLASGLGSPRAATLIPQWLATAPTLATLAASVASASVGQAVTLTATVAALLPTDGTPTGTVTFLDGTNPLGTVALSGGTATFTTAGLAVGRHSLTAVYNGNGPFTTSSSAPVAVEIRAAHTPTPGLPGQTVTLDAAVGAGRTPSQRLVAQLYRDLLHREPDADGLGLFSTLLQQGQATRLHVVQAIQASPEYHHLVVQEAYARLLGRAADPGGLAAATAFLRHGGSREQLEMALLASDEYYLNRGGTTAHFVAALYRDVLGRSADTEGLQAWSATVAAGLPRSAAAAAFRQGGEARTKEVQALYEQLLHRPADPRGLTLFVGALQQGATHEQVAAVLAGSAEYHRGVNHAVHQRYVTQLYRQLLEREPDGAGLAFWTGLLDEGLETPARVARGIQESPEGRTLQVRQLHGRYLQRGADSAGLAAGVDFLARGGTTEQLAALLIGSVEFAQRSGGSDEGFLEALYQSALHRPAEPAGRAAFGQALRQGASRAQVAAAVLGSPEYQRGLVQGLYQRVLDRAGDPEGVAAWLTALQAGLPSGRVVEGLVSSDEFLARL